MSGKGKGSALSAALEKWKKDQARNQALQTQIADDQAKKAKKAAKTAATKRAPKSGAGSTTAAAASTSGAEAPAYSKALLRTTVVAKASAVPLAKQIKDSLDALQRAQAPLSAQELQEAAGHECGAGSPLAEHLARNPKVEIRDGKYRFRAAAEVRVQDREGVLRFVQSSRGCLLRDLTSAYPAAAADVAALRGEGRLWVLPAAEREQQALFPREQPPLIEVSADVLRLWHDAEVPEDPEEQARELRRAGLTAALQPGKRARPKPAKKEKQRKKRAVNFDRFTRITNQHLPELFTGDAATSID